MPIFLGKNKVSCKYLIPTTDTLDSGKKAVNFYDYEGTLLHSYTKAEALGLSGLPGLPDRISEGLTCQGWNWTLENIKTYLTENEDDSFINVGATYIPTDGATHINITFADKYRNKMPLMFRGNVTIDWGDGNTQTVDHTSTTTITHEYAIAQSYPAKYTIKLTVNSGTLKFGDGSGFNICGSTSQNTSNPARAYSSRIDSVFIGNGVSISKHAFSYCPSLATVTIPNGVTSIGSGAFNSCYSLTSISIPSGVESIDDAAFGGCSTLTSISIPNSVTSIGNNAFQSCYSIASISIPNNVTDIDAYTFYGCSSLTSISIPNGISSISGYAFQYCYSLASVTIPGSVKSIGTQTFQNCSALTSVTISNGVTSIGTNAFGNCYSLTSITIPNSVTSIGTHTFQYCYSLASVTISNGITSIGNYAFQYCYSLTSVTIPDNVSSIGTSAFQYCYSLTSVTIPNSVTSIGNSAFSDCDSLASVTISNSITDIGTQAFYNCYGIIKYDFSNHTSDEPPTLAGTNAFYNIATDAKIVVPDALYNSWITATNWSDESIKPHIIKASEYDEPQYVPPHTIITYVDGSTVEINVGDDGILTRELLADAHQYADITSIQSAEIGSDVTTIESEAFWDCSSLTTVTIPKGVTSIEYQTFGYCTSLTPVTIPSSVTSIGSRAFCYCTSLTSVTIPEGVTSIGEGAFESCIGLTNIILENRTLEEAQSLIGTLNLIGYAGTVTYNGGTYNTVDSGTAGGGGGA